MIGETTNVSDLIRISEKQGVPLKRSHIVLTNELKNLKKVNEMLIILNLDDSNDIKYQGGTHWTAIYKKGNDVLYFDSFGIKPPKEVTQYFNNELIAYNTYQIQELKSNNCGKYCIMFFMAILSDTDYEDFINYFDQKGNDKKIFI